MNLRRLDLNLLLIFDVLMQELSITRAAEKLAMTQPTVSHALQRLREQIGDPLLTRSGAGMQPSSKALELHRAIHGPLMDIDLALNPQGGFVPAQSDRTFSIATTDYVEALLLPALLKEIESQAPNVKLLLRQLHHRLPLEDLEAGKVDLVIGREKNLLKKFASQAVIEDGYLCAMASDHELAGKKLTLQKFLKQKHIFVRPESMHRSDERKLFAEVQEQLKVAAVVQHVLVAMHAVANSNLLTIGPARLLREMADVYDIYLTKPPVELPCFNFSLIWNQNRSADEGLEWLRNLIVKTLDTGNDV